MEISFGKEEGIGFQGFPLFPKSSGVVYVPTRRVAGRWFHWERLLNTGNEALYLFLQEKLLRAGLVFRNLVIWSSFGYSDHHSFFLFSVVIYKSSSNVPRSGLEPNFSNAFPIHI